MKNLLVSMTRHPLGLLGAALTTASALIFFTLLGIYLVGYEGGPYGGIITFIVLPGIFVVGLLMIPLGVWLHRRKVSRGGDIREFPVIDLNEGRTQRQVIVIIALTLVNIGILGIATYKGVHYMDSTAFCGQVCHSVMDPEFTAYQRSPHSRVNCVDCHIGPGADWFVKSKLSGSWQLISTTFDLYPRPIPTPVHNLRPARDTCEQCHWPDKFVGDRLKVLTRFAEDEENTETKTVLLMRIGGVEGRLSEGIHWHVDPGIQIRYRSEEDRETIYEVELTRADGAVETFYPGGAPAEGEEAATREQLPWRQMDCVDCHNRPTHIYRMPDEEMDSALQDGRLDRTLPYLRHEGQALLEENWASHEEARQEIPARLLAFYGESYPEIATARRASIEAAGNVIAELFALNVHPQMNITWGSYPSHIGHERTNGCFRCHDDDHSTTTGEAVISQDCDTCHSLLAMEEEDPEILAELNP